LAKKERAPRFKTPKAEALYPYLTAPDEFKGKKSWKTTLRLHEDSDACATLKEQIDSLVDEAFEAEMSKLKGKAKKECAKYYPYEEEYDENDELTGNLLFHFKRAAEYSDKNTGELKTINIFRYDRFGKRIQDDQMEAKIGNPMSGTVLRVEFEPFQFYNSAAGNAGVSCRIVSVQFIDIKQFEGGGAGWDNEGDEGGATPARNADERDDF